MELEGVQLQRVAEVCYFGGVIKEAFSQERTFRDLGGGIGYVKSTEKSVFVWR